MTRPDPHASYRKHVSSKAEAVEEDAPEAAIFRSIRFIRETLAGADTTSLPIDYSVERMAQDRMADIESLRAQLATARKALEKLIQSSKLLQQNSVGCAELHHGLDTNLNGLPGWLTDTQKDIDEAVATLNSEEQK